MLLDVQIVGKQVEWCYHENCPKTPWNGRCHANCPETPVNVLSYMTAYIHFAKLTRFNHTVVELALKLTVLLKTPPTDTLIPHQQVKKLDHGVLHKNKVKKRC